ncbi:hypothetical protein PoB_004016500 [Plakobranchus ocellatus]|uniref:Uncharacterized protein n=1 Tax=Plakobranchus ocellatus TaxID=259542 RepID=A0AAV4AZ64_9GAST|nr:hypothetical protein PoB_004016500 [Plakobranchus ocellatus]
MIILDTVSTPLVTFTSAQETKNKKEKKVGGGRGLEEEKVEEEVAERAKQCPKYCPQSIENAILFDPCR